LDACVLEAGERGEVHEFCDDCGRAEVKDGFLGAFVEVVFLGCDVCGFFVWVEFDGAL
jgi:hypothetical protein